MILLLNKESIMRTLKLILWGCTTLFAASAGFARGGDATYPATMARIHAKLSHLGVENARHGNVQAEFQNGVVVLTGTAESVGVKNDVEKQIAKAAGRIRWWIRPPSTPRTPPRP